ncbi:hypothetical protein LtaPh_0408500 [Leishmania tarentolae]|uniref:Uncharacterized protein n=1 Tax=Leishmania tarentolae TaxID=5689 RepID=A0A640K9N1_LEITA|nr:hypothetical protein LtaPh_0408500 [Leishmania tarentolae]
MPSTPHDPCLLQRASRARQDAKRYHHASVTPSPQASSASYEHHGGGAAAVAGPAGRRVSGRGSPTMQTNKVAPYLSDVSHGLPRSGPALAQTAESAVALTQPSSSLPQAQRSVVYTVQNSTTDTHTHETEYGGVLTICTTTVTRTITERLVASDEDSSSEDSEVHLDDARKEAFPPSFSRGEP